MSFAPDSNTPPTPITQNPTAMMRLPVGAVSPLWGLFAGAAVTGAAWWWMTRWARPENLEAMFGAAAKVDEAVLVAMENAVAALPEPIVEEAPPVLEAVAEVVETAAEVAAPAIEAVAEAPEAVVETVEAVAETPETVVEALVEAPVEALEPVGGEAAPISPVLEALSPEIATPVLEEPSAPATLADAAPPAPKRRPIPKARLDTPDEG